MRSAQRSKRAIGHAKAAWPLAAIRTLADVLIETASGRSKGPAFEARWLNLTGFCLRPGFGSATDSFRVGELRKVYMAGLMFPKDVQNQVEWIVLWQRVGAGFSTGQQRELAQRIGGGLGLGQGKRPGSTRRSNGNRGVWSPRSSGSMRPIAPRSETS